MVTSQLHRGNDRFVESSENAQPTCCAEDKALQAAQRIALFMGDQKLECWDIIMFSKVDMSDMPTKGCDAHIAGCCFSGKLLQMHDYWDGEKYSCGPAITLPHPDLSSSRAQRVKGH